MILCEFSFFPSICDCAYVTPALCVSNAMMFQHEWDFVRFNVSVRLIRQIAGLSGKYRPSLPSFLSSPFPRWVAIPPVDQQMAAFPHQTTALLAPDCA